VGCQRAVLGLPPASGSAGVTYIRAAAGLADAVGIAPDDDVGVEGGAGAVGDVGLGALVLASGLVVVDLGAGKGRRGGENEGGLHDDGWLGSGRTG